MRAICLALLPFVLAACSAVPNAVPLPGSGAPRGPFIPRDEFPVPPNVDRMIGPEDCRGSTLAAVGAGIPDYPPRAWSLGRQGWVVVRFDVEADGRTDRVRIARAVPDGPFDRESRATVRDWRFRPLDAGVARLENCVVMFEFRAGEVFLR
jgi:protein TonB